MSISRLTHFKLIFENDTKDFKTLIDAAYIAYTLYTIGPGEGVLGAARRSPSVPQAPRAPEREA